MRLRPDDWGEMTLSEFYHAVQGFNDLEEERLKWQFFCTRKIAWWCTQKVNMDESPIEEEDILSIPELDEEIKKARIEILPIVQVQVDGADEPK